MTGGTRIEIKGVPSLRAIPRLTHNEALRQRIDRHAFIATHPDDAAVRVTALIALMERFTYLAVNRDLGDRDTVVETAATVIHRSFFAEAA